jgi:hypothetical protein
VTEKDDTSSQTEVFGDVGVAKNGNISWSSNSIIRGDLSYRTPGKLTKSGNAMITGAIHHDASSDALLDQGGHDDAMNASAVLSRIAFLSNTRL